MNPATVVMIGQLALLLYALVLVMGGIVGFLKARSQASLIAGLGSGAVALISLGLTWMGGFGFWIGLILAALMTAMFAARLRKTGKFMPSGMLVGVSALMVVMMGLAISHLG